MARLKVERARAGLEHTRAVPNASYEEDARGKTAGKGTIVISGATTVITDDTDDPDKLSGMLAQAAAEPMPVNPSFQASAFDEEKALLRYAEILTSMAEENAHAHRN